jgi:Kdo2-lipid IVA lauroyltransferase/acyltransferase
MQFLAFILLYPIIWIISILPFPLFYAFSDLVYFFIYRVFKYRKRTVRHNLVLALPHLSDEERNQIEKKFFAHMCDMFLEITKTMSITQKQIDKRFTYTNLDLMKKLESKNKSIVLMCSHYGSYEWAVSLNKFLDFRGYAIYKKISNPYFNKLVKKIRNRFDAYLITTKETIPTIEENAEKGILSVYGFAGDQSPQLHSGNYWSDFMGISVPVYVGAETMAKKFNMEVIFLNTKKIKRGHYEATFEMISENPSKEEEFAITEKFLRMVEKQVYEKPEFYLWTHKRWKHMNKKPNSKTTN